MTEFTLGEVAQAVAALTFLVLAATVVRRRVRFLRTLYVPNAVTAGVIGLLIGPQVLGKLFDSGTRMAEGVFGDQILAVWSLLPGPADQRRLRGDPAREADPERARDLEPLLVPGVVRRDAQLRPVRARVLLAVTVLVPVFGMSELSGALLEISFSGGHGTAAGLNQTMTDNGFSEGTDLALGLATVGLLGGILVGTFLINRAVRSDKMTIAREQEVDHRDERHELSRLDTTPEIPEEHASPIPPRAH